VHGARPQEWKDADMTRMDYCKCDSNNYKECRWYERAKERDLIENKTS